MASTPTNSNPKGNPAGIAGNQPGATDEQRRGRGVAIGSRGGAFAKAEGAVTDKDPPVQGDPVPGVDVSIEQSPGGIIISSTQTNNSGQFTFTGLVPGNYVVRAGATPGRKLNVTGNQATGRVTTTGIFGASGSMQGGTGTRHS